MTLSEGGKGGIELAVAVVEATNKLNRFHYLYPLHLSIKEKIETIATKIYGADGINYTCLAVKKIRLFTELELDKLPICMAKTHLSLSHET